MRGAAAYLLRRKEARRWARKTDKVRFGLTGGTIRTEILGSRRLILEGCDGIVEYGAEQIGFRCGRQQVWVRGKNLRLVRVEEDSAVLSGKIEEVAYR